MYLFCPKLGPQLLTKTKNEHYVETIMRTVTTEMGSSAALCPPPIAVADARDYGVPRSQSLAWRIGRAIAIGRQKKWVYWYCVFGYRSPFISATSKASQIQY